MDSVQQQSFLDPASAASDNVSKQKAATRRIAKEQEKAIHEKLLRNNHPIPKYEFLELIGKGAYGRVFKAYDQIENRVVALKVIDVDSHDYKVNAREKDDSIEVTMHEIKILKQLKDANTKNVNVIFDAFQIHSQLWIVNEYCPGGSVRTLMRGTGDRLEDKYIVPIARELALALKAIHDGGIIHRDVKAANVMVHEQGRLQVIDFGVAGVLQTSIDKRSTVIGTPHWMAPELHKLAPPEGLSYGTEVDVWAYGCTLYEIATGMPPYPRTQPGRMLGITLGRSPPRLDKLDHSEGLSDLVAFVLEAKPANRPSMEAVLQHPYIFGSEITHPTESLAELVKIYYRWEHSGGQRQSLFINAGAAAAEFPQTLNEEEDWNFSTTSNFEKELSEFAFDPNTSTSTTFNLDHVSEAPSSQATQLSDKHLALPSVSFPSQLPHYEFKMSESHSEAQTPTGDLTPVEKLNTEERVKRGENALKGLFNENQAPYKYEIKADFVDQKPITAGPSNIGKSVPRRTSDLPLRDESAQSSVHRKEFDADQVRSASYDNLPNIDLANVGTIKANRMNRFLENMGQDKGNDSTYYGDRPEDDKRATKDWTFPSAPSAEVAQDPKRATIEWGFPPEMQAGPNHPQPMKERPALKHIATAPVGEVRHSAAGMIDLDALYDDPLNDGTIMQAAPPSDEEAFSRLSLGEDHKPTQSSDGAETPHASGNASTVRAGFASEDEPKSASSIASEDEIDYNPFMFDEQSDEEAKAQINSYLDEQGVTDVLERAALRRDLLLARKEAKTELLENEGYEEFKKRRYATAVGSYPEREQGAAIWAKYDPDTNPAPEPKLWAMGKPSRIGEPDFPLSRGLQTQFNTASQHGGASNSGSGAKLTTRPFPEIIPPSAESLMEGAPPAVLEGELRRLLGTWTEGFDILGEIYDNHLANSHRGSSNRNGGTNRNGNGDSGSSGSSGGAAA